MAAFAREHSSEELLDYEVIDIVSSEEYDSQRAKLRASLSWLLSKVYGSSIPKEYHDPFYETSEGQLVLRPVMVNLMSSSELYCQACSRMFPETPTQWQGFWSIIQVLSRRGIYIFDAQESAVTETVLVQTAPFRLKAHLALIDALMKAYTHEVASVEKVVKAVRQITTFPASSELPCSPEEALVFWINKVCIVLRTEGVSKGRFEEVLEGTAGQKVRVFTRSPGFQEPVQVPPLEDLMRDIGDGCCVAALIAFYRPHQLSLKDLCLKDGIGIADSLFNLRQIGKFCRSHLPFKCFHFSYEDLLYAHISMKANILAFLADLFFCFEGPGQSEGKEMNSAKSSNERVDVSTPGKKSWQSMSPNAPVSLAAKRSFNRQTFEETLGNLNLGRPAASSTNSNQPLLPRKIPGRYCVPQEEGGNSVAPSNKRQAGRRSMSLSSQQDREIIQKSVIAWQDDQRLSQRSDDYEGGRGPSPEVDASDSSIQNQNFNANNNFGLDLSSHHTADSVLEAGISDMTGSESITSIKTQHPTDHIFTRMHQTSPPLQKLEPLMPAVLKPAKEKGINLSKAEERGERSSRKKKPPSPTEISQALNMRQNPPKNDGSTGSRSSNSSCEEATATSLISGGAQSPLNKAQAQAGRGKGFEAFVIESDSIRGAPLGSPTKLKHSGNSSPLLSGRALSTSGSYIVEDRVSSIQAARAAGIPVIADKEDPTSTNARSREGSVASSGDYSDHESRKIQQEYKVRESGIATTPNMTYVDANMNNNNVCGKPKILLSDHPNVSPNHGNNYGEFKLSPSYEDFNKISPSHGDFNKLSPTVTNFAEMKRLKDYLGYDFSRMDKSALIYMQSGSQGGPYDKISGFDLKSNYLTKQGQGHEDKASSVDQNQVTSPEMVPDNAVIEANGADQGLSEMRQLRLKLEQKRKDIERKKHRQEAHHNKMRQQLGKAAFMRVVSKHLDGGDREESSDVSEVTRGEISPNSPQAQLEARLGHPSPMLPAASSPRSHSPAAGYAAPVTTVQGSAIPADASAQRFTDWRTQSQLSRGGNISNLTSGDKQPRNLIQAQQFLLPRAGAIGSGEVVSPSSSSQTLGNKAFSRMGIQQTIDNVRNKWFGDENDLISGGRGGSEEEDVDGKSFRLHDQDLLAGVRGIRDHSPSPARSHSQSPIHGAKHFASSPVAVPSRETTSSPRPVSELEYQQYDSSLDKLNNSLTELQGEIMRLSLQHEQLRATQSPASPSLTQPRPIQGIPKQSPYMEQGGIDWQGGSISLPQQLVRSDPGPVPHLRYNSPPDDYNDNIPMDSLQPIYTDTFPPEVGSTFDQPMQDSSGSEEVMNNSNNGFFISFGDSSTPKSSKPKLSDRRSRGASPSPSASQAGLATIMTESSGSGSDLASSLTGQSDVAAFTPTKNGEPSSEPSPNIGFIVTDEAAAGNEMAKEDEMQKKKIKLMELQKKRKEKQEKKKMEKEAETATKQVEKQLKEEELERKKAEDKARREVIFQQYLQKKQEEEDVPAKPMLRKREGSANKPRPKSMFNKSKAMTPESGSMALDSGSSSQEDLTSRANSGRSTPSVISAMRSAYHFRLPQPSKIRKAVSCNTLQGTPNGAQGSSTYRRPPSPEFPRLKQRQRGSSQDLGSEAGSVSNVAVAEYAGPKLFVKPSAKSNRHIIVNAISHCCLAGSVNTDLKNKVLEEMSKCDANHFLILFRDGGCQYRGLFILYPETEEAFKVHGVGPKHIDSAMCEKFYKYNSGAKSFSEITSTKHLSVSVDAVVLHTAVWKSVKSAAKR